MSSTLEIIDDFFALRNAEDFSQVPGRSIREFGSQILTSSRDVPAHLTPERQPVYVGGWPSANFGLVHGDLLLTSLLYNEQLLIRDPIADWFAPEQHLVEHALAARPGYWDPQANQPHMRETRQFLNVAMAHLRALRPLIDAGIVVPVPTARRVYEQRVPTRRLVDRLVRNPALAPSQYTAAYSPADIPVEDNVRGMFIFASGPNPETRIAESLRRGLTYFAREFLVAASYGATYTAAFDHELFLCRTGTRDFVRPATRTSEAILQSDLPIFSGLTPTLIAKVHDDDMFGQFRADLHELYQNAPVNGTQSDLAAYVSDQERTLLQPRLDEARKAADRGVLQRIGAGLNAGKFGIAAGLAIDLALQSPGLATGLNVAREVANGFLDAPRKQGSQRVWSSLIRHHRSVGVELRDLQAKPGSITGWAVPTEPSMEVTITPGTIIHDFVPQPNSVPHATPSGYTAGDYRPCPCGSGLRYRFCCEEPDRRGPIVVSA
ncbi:YecA family protein [Curtobacterium sp. L1-20]|uniref:YecA/YgfB family protein n=1 Tax=Curtobacterium sp. L1-20 TaxID=3138181 RepID=UPI003B51C76D